MPSGNDPPGNRPWDRRQPDDHDSRPRRRDDYEFDDDRPRRRGGFDAGPPPPSGNGLGIAALILGLLSFCTGPLTGLPGVICGVFALMRPTGRGLALTGIGLSVLGTIVSVGATYYAVMQVRESAQRQIDQNNLRIIGLASSDQRNLRGAISAPYATDQFWKVNTGLSWRVGILPHFEQNALYEQFDLAQPWDSDRNRPYSDRYIKVYANPFDEMKGSLNTPYRVFYGGGAMFHEDGKPVRLELITDGPSNTIMVVHAAEHVPWASPREIRYGEDIPLPKLGHPKMSRGFPVLMADGSVRVLSSNVSERTLRAAITSNGGEVLGGDW